MVRASMSSSVASSFAPRFEAPTPAAGIDAGTQDEAERIGGRRRVDAGSIGQRAQAGIVPEAEHLQTLGHEGAVRLLERHHVANGRERHEIEQAEQVRLGAIAIIALAAQHPRRRHQEQENDACGRQMPLP